MKYIAYCRKSTDEKEKQILSIDQQIYELKQFAQRENLEIVEFLTEAQTAKVPGRKVFSNFISLVEKGVAQGIIAWHPDRLARNSIGGGKIIYLLDEGKLQSLKFPTFWFENTPQGRFMLNIAFGQAKYYVDNLSENVKRGLYHKLRHGGWPSLAPIGYLNDRNLRSVIVHPKEGKLVKLAFLKFSSGEFSSMKDIQTFFFKNKLFKAGEKPMHYNQIRAILTNSFYYGLMLYHGETYEGSHKPLISKKTFDKAQEILEKKYSKKPHKHEFDFTGFITCKECGSFVTAETHKKFYRKTNRNATYIYYRCVKKKGICSQKYLREEKVEKQLREIVESVSLNEKWQAKMLELLAKDEIKEKETIKSELRSLTVSLEAVEEKLDKLLEGYLEEIVDTEDYQAKKKDFLDKKKVLKEKISEVKQKGSAWLEPMREFINEAAEAAKIARKKNNCDELSVIAKKVGSNFYMMNKRIYFEPCAPHIALAARPVAARAYPTATILCRGWDSNPHVRLSNTGF